MNCFKARVCLENAPKNLGGDFLSCIQEAREHIDNAEQLWREMAPDIRKTS
jgi:hypothetical protein